MPLRRFALAAAEEESARVATLSEHLDEHTVITSELQLVKAIEFQGLDPQTATDEALAGRYRTLSDALKNVECQGLVIKVFTVKRRVRIQERLVAHVSEFALTERYHESINAAGCYRIRIIVVLEKNARRAASGLLAGFHAASAGTIAAAVDTARAEINAAADRISSALSAFAPRPLGTAQRGGRVVSEIASFFNFLLEARMRDVECGSLPLSERMGKARIAYPHLDHIEFRLPSEVALGAMLGVSALPGRPGGRCHASPSLGAGGVRQLCGLAVRQPGVRPRAGAAAASQARGDA